MQRVKTAINSPGQIGQDRPLQIYMIEKLPGITYMEYQLQGETSQSLDEQPYKRQQTLVEEFARFFAASWHTPQPADTAAMRQTLENELRLLTQNLPSRFSQRILWLLDDLECVLEKLPVVLAHDDLDQMNFLVEESSGHLTGVIDWAETKILPFGFNFSGLENILGYMDLHGWYYFDQHAISRDFFWKTPHHAVAADKPLLHLQDTIEVARRTGVLFRYGFRWDDNMQRKVVQDGGSGTRYLDALFR